MSGQPYNENKAFETTPASTASRLKHLQHQAKALNMTFVPANDIHALRFKRPLHLQRNSNTW